MSFPVRAGTLRSSRGVLIVGAVAFVVALGSSSVADAAKIRPRTLVQTEFGPMPIRFVRFLEAGPDTWALMSPRIPRGLRLTTDSTGALPSGAFVDYLLWRRDLNPTRFDSFHRRLAPLLATPQILPSPQVPPIVPPTPQVIPPPLVPPSRQQVPEPSSWLTAVALTMVGGWAVRSRKARTVGMTAEGPNPGDSRSI